ncbi:MAG: hypothetical protein DWQ05_15075 [Calditrichaeota bacterium]|nr:MAG: hypothetical protein DWQ05_15075 [Calditrichota bacterium]
MNKWRILHKSALIVLLICFLLNTGCSIVLPTIMHNKNQNMQPTSLIEDAKSLKKIKPKFTPRLTKNDGEVIEGDFIDLFKYEKPEYDKLYTKFSSTPVKTVLPAIGDTLFIVMESGKSIHGMFIGFDFYQICINNGDKERMNIDIAKIDKLLWKKDAIPKHGLVELFNIKNPRLPLYSYLALDVAGTQSVVSLNEIDTIEKVNQKRNIFGYFILGIVPDLIGLLFFLAYTFSRGGGFG